MLTNKTLTNNLERRITASALNTFRQIPRPEKQTASWFVFHSSIDGIVFDECFVNYATWKLDHINYTVNNGNKQIDKSIVFN